RGILRGLNSTFWHQTVSGADLRAYISRQAGQDLSKVFEQYLETTKIPVLEYRIANGTLSYRWANVVKGFAMPVRVAMPGASASSWTLLRPTEAWSSMKLPNTPRGAALRVDPNFYVEARATP